ncbi:SDR family NAD(P)-dependent oxidoreductase [Amycolatopsis sp. NPDC051903]|uniref:SDR family NAD(P)-dependent oxidoreductase n=1 Tax=Amycolatopsis sp. NPDC051903 TaxID=3363936 RepID=UPI00378EB698
MPRLAGKTAIVTGASSGMGRATAELFAAEGAQVALTDVDAANGAAAAAGIGAAARFWQVDVRDESSIERAYDEIAAHFGKLDVLVNCAGVIGVDKPTHEVTEAEWDQLFAVDVKGVFFSTKHAVPHLIANGGGSIVNYSSIYGLVGNDEFTPYHVAKGAVTMQTKQDAAMYGKYDIRVNSVHPSTVLTPLVEGIAAAYEGGLPAYERMMTANQSLRRLGRPIDVAYAVLYLASDEASWVTGVNLPVDGGYTAR